MDEDNLQCFHSCCCTFILVYIFYNATDLQETQSEETAFVQLDRKLRVMEKCRVLQKSGTMNPSAHFLVDDRRKFIYCWIPKVTARQLSGFVCFQFWKYYNLYIPK